MKIDDCFYLGYISKTIGTKGELAFKLDVDSPSSYTQLSSVLIQIQQNDLQLVPYFLHGVSLHSNELLRCSIEGVNAVAVAKKLVGKSLYLPLNMLPKLGDDQFYFHDIIGYQLIDAQKGPLGKVEKVLEYGSSNLFSLTIAEKEVLIPISDELIERIDKKAAEIYLNCPEGLIDLYLEA